MTSLVRHTGARLAHESGFIGFANDSDTVFHTESLLLRQADGGSDPIWGGKIVRSIQ